MTLIQPSRVESVFTDLSDPTISNVYALPVRVGVLTMIVVTDDIPTAIEVLIETSVNGVDFVPRGSITQSDFTTAIAGIQAEIDATRFVRFNVISLDVVINSLKFVFKDF